MARGTDLSPLPKRLCQFCKGQVDPWGVVVTYQDRWYHLPCWSKVQGIAGRTGGAL